MPEAPDVEDLARTLIDALDVARQAHFARENWDAAALGRVDRILQIEQEVGRAAQDIAAARMNPLANYLKKTGAPAALAESSGHQMAGLIYCIVAGLGQSLKTSFRNYVIDFRCARNGEPVVPPPRLAPAPLPPARAVARSAPDEPGGAAGDDRRNPG